MRVIPLLAWLPAAGLTVFAGAIAETELLSFKLPQSTVFEVQHPAREKVSPCSSRFDWLRAQRIGASPGGVELGNRIVVQTLSAPNLPSLLAGSPLSLARTITPTVVILQAPDALTAAREAHRLSLLSEMLACYPVLRRPGKLNGPYVPRPTDHEFPAQWPLENRAADGRPQGVDLNVRSAWPYTRGQGITIADVDSGVELTHPELALAAQGSPHFDFVSQSASGAPLGRSAFWAHGTEVAGLMVAEMNTARMVGVAPEAKLASWVIFDTSLNLASDEHLMDMYQYQPNTVAVQNHSWSTHDIPLGGPTLLEQVGLSNAFLFGRSGKGVVMVRAAGNGREAGSNGNDDSYVSDPRTISVAAARPDGRVARYSEPGACVLVAAPSGDSGSSGLFTTDLLGSSGVNQFGFFPPNEDLSDYAFNSVGFSGTSAAAPQIAAVVALMLSANPNLAVRDVQQVLLLSARHFDFADPDLRTNGAGLLVSHNLGFGVPDAGVAVRLALGWSNRPATTRTTVSSSRTLGIPDDGLRVEITGPGVPSDLAAIRCLPGTGLHPDDPTPALPLVDVGEANGPISLNLTNRGALIIRGGSNYSVKLQNAADAGAAFAVVYNFATNTSSTSAPGGDQLIPLAGTDFDPIPGVFIGYSDGLRLQALIQSNAAARAQLRLRNTNCVFLVTNSLLCEHVALRVQTDHPLRGDLRITLLSPSGTRSVLQRYNADTNAGPVDWAYYSTQHFLESSVGNWTAFFSDEFAEATGSVHLASLSIDGVPIQDSDHDGLDDPWELAHFGNLAQGPQDDPDEDGYSNAREQIMGTNPNEPDLPFQLDLSRWSSSILRLSWPSRPGFQYEVWGGADPTALSVQATVDSRWPETEWFTPANIPPLQFYQVRGRRAQR